MSTYTRPDKFIPVNISSDPTAYLGYVQKRMDLQAQGEAIIQNQYKQYLDLDLTHDANKEKLNTFLKSASENLSQYTTKDMSNYDNVKKAVSVFEPLTTDKQYESVLYDNKFTKHYRNQIGIAEAFKNKIDKKGNIGTGYSDSNYAVLMNSYNKFASSPNSEDYESWGKLETYQPYYDYKEEHQKLVSDFLKQPDEFEIETLQPETGMTQKVKFQGKSADQINNYVSSMLSDKAKSQMLIEGRAQSYGVSDSDFEKMYNDTLDKNINSVKDKLDDLSVYKSIDGKKLSSEELKQQKSLLESQLEELSNTKKGLTNPATRAKYVKEKESVFANTYLSNTLAQLAMSTENKRMSSTYGTNNAYVSLLARQQGWREFMMDLDFEKTKHAADLKFKYAKEGLNPDGTSVSGGKTPYETIVPSIEDRTVEEIEAVIKNKELEIDGFVKQTIAKTGKYAFDALGMSPSADPAEELEQRKKAFSYIHSLADKRNDPTNQKLLNTPDKDLTSRQLADKRILQELKTNDAKVDIANNYYARKAEVKKNIKSQLLTDIKNQGLTIDEINAALETDLFQNLPTRMGKGMMTMFGPAIRAGAEAATGTKQIMDFFSDGKNKISSIDEFADRIISDPEFAKKASESIKEYNEVSWKNAGSNSISYGLDAIQAATNIPIGNNRIITKQEIGQNQIDYSVYNNLMNKSIIDTFGLLGMKQVYSRPAAVRTAGDKQSESLFNQRIADVIATYKDVSPELVNLDPQNIQRISVENGKITIEAFPTEIDDKGKVTKTGDPITPIVIEDANIQNSTEVDNDYNIALALNPQGVLNKRITTDAGDYEYRVRTTSGTPYSPYTRNNAPLSLEMKIGDVFVPINTETNFQTPSDAIKAIESIVPEYEKAVASEIIPQLIKQEGSKEAMLKKYPNATIRSLVKEEIKRMADNGSVYRVFGLTNPNKTGLEQTIDDILDNL